MREQAKQRAIVCFAKKPEKPNFRHGQSKTREFHIWADMRKRCLNPNANAFERYGGRGITFCEPWSKFPQFLADMGPCPPGFTLDRINNDGPYSPENCRWASRKDQARNRKTSKQITAFGRTQTLAAWAEETGMGYCTLTNRLRDGWLPEEALTRPKRV